MKQTIFDLIKIKKETEKVEKKVNELNIELLRRNAENLMKAQNLRNR